ncbi:P-loop containing nucleoside triphosphate hydrolase protein [Lenzites betulinus]|nr:P-loop containing nucleoside triphosphate hydrolase protein [Lenzites betulinus]
MSRQELEALICAKCRVKTPRDFQITHGLDMIQKKDLILVVASGMGKTLAMAVPLLAAQAAGEAGIAVIVVPSHILAEQQAKTFCEYGLRALAITQLTVRKASYKRRDLVAELRAGRDVRVAVITSETFHTVISSGKKRTQVRWFMVDEVQLANKNDPNPWMVVYNLILDMRSSLGSDVLWAVFTGSATVAETAQISRSLGFQPGSFVNARYSLDRRNIKYIPKFLQHPVSGSQFLDLSFLIPTSVTVVSDIPSTLIFCESMELGHQIIGFLDSLLPAHLPGGDRLIMPCNELVMDSDYQEPETFKRNMDSGSIRIAVVSDLGTYGLDVLASRVVTLSVNEIPPYNELLQQWGRAARGGAPGLVYAFAPAWARVLPPGEVVTTQQKADEARRANLPPVVLQFFNASASRCPREVHLAHNSEPFDRPTPCCSLHDPAPEEAADRATVARWTARLVKPPPPKPTGPWSDGASYALPEAYMKESMVHLVHRWRVRTWQALQVKTEPWPSTMFLPTCIITRLCEYGLACTTFERFAQTIADIEWKYMDSHGWELFELISPVLRGFARVLSERAANEVD